MTTTTPPPDPRWLWMLGAMQALYDALDPGDWPGVMLLAARSSAGEHLHYSTSAGTGLGVSKRLVAEDAATEAAADSWLARTTIDLTAPDDAGELET